MGTEALSHNRALIVGGLLTAALAGGAVWHASRTQPAVGPPHLVGEDVRILVDGTENRDVLLGGQSGQLRFYVPDRCLVYDMERDGEPPIEKAPKSATILDPPGDGGASWIGIVWPYGTTVIQNGDRYGVRLASGTEYLAGDIVKGAGGGWPENDDPGYHDNYGLPANCVGGSLDQLVP